VAGSRWQVRGEENQESGIRMDEAAAVVEDGRRAPPGFLAVEDGEGHLLFFFDPERDLVQIRVKGRTSLIDLRMYRPARKAQGKVL
jgi:hypothetical protein